MTGSLSVNPPRDMRGPATPPGAPPPPSFVAAVGTDGSASVSGFTHVKGSFVAAGVGDVLLADAGTISGNVRSGGRPEDLDEDAFLVAGDAFVNGNVDGPFAIQGSIHLPPTSTLAPDVQGGSVDAEPVSVSPPCDCADGPAFDVAQPPSRGRKTKNANAILPFADTHSTSREQRRPRLAVRRVLPDGDTHRRRPARSSFASMDTSASSSRATCASASNLHVTLDAGADLDLVVAGSFFMTGRVFGSPTTPALTRLWVGSTTVSLPDQVQFGAFVYAPAAVFSAGVRHDLLGHALRGHAVGAGDVRISYDPTAMQAGAELRRRRARARRVIDPLAGARAAPSQPWAGECRTRDPSLARRASLCRRPARPPCGE